MTLHAVLSIYLVSYILENQVGCEIMIIKSHWWDKTLVNQETIAKLSYFLLPKHTILKYYSAQNWIFKLSMSEQA